MEGKYRFFKSSRAGMADVFYNGGTILLPYYVAEELCTAANHHYGLLNEITKLKEEIKQLKQRIPNESEGIH